MTDTLTLDDAIAALPEGDDIHTFMNPGGMLIGADWSRAQIVEALKASPEIRITGPMAQGMKHGIAIKHPNRADDLLYVATRTRTDSEKVAS